MFIRTHFSHSLFFRFVFVLMCFVHSQCSEFYHVPNEKKMLYCIYILFALFGLQTFFKLSLSLSFIYSTGVEGASVCLGIRTEMNDRRCHILLRFIAENRVKKRTKKNPREHNMFRTNMQLLLKKKTLNACHVKRENENTSKYIPVLFSFFFLLVLFYWCCCCSHFTSLLHRHLLVGTSQCLYLHDVGLSAITHFIWILVSILCFSSKCEHEYELLCQTKNGFSFIFVLISSYFLSSFFSYSFEMKCIRSLLPNLIRLNKKKISMLVKKFTGKYYKMKRNEKSSFVCVSITNFLFARLQTHKQT